MKNSEQITKIMDNTIHGLLIKNVKSLCEKIVSDPQFLKMYTHDKENYILNKLRHDFTDCYINLMDSIDDDFSNCELNDFKNLCYRGMKITSQLIRIDHAIKRFDYRRKLTVWEKSEHIFNKVNDILEILGCKLSKQEYKILMNARNDDISKKMTDIVKNRVLKSINSGNPSEWHSMVYKLNSETGEEDIIDID